LFTPLNHICKIGLRHTWIFFSGVHCNNCNVTTNLLARAFIALVAVFALARSTGAAGLGIADAADALALAKPEIIGIK
jgi:hypothetical protein